MDLRVAGVFLMLLGLSLEQKCDQCDCIISQNDESRGVHNMMLTCLEGTITWYNPVGSLRLEVKPNKLKHFETCFIVETGQAKLKISQEVEKSINSKSPVQRSNYVMNDHNLQTLLTVQGTSKEYCISSRKPIILYLEPEVTEYLGYQKVTFKYDSTPMTEMKSSIEVCRPCSEDEILRAYCSSDFVLVGSMDSVEHYPDVEKTKINVAVNQIIRQKDSPMAHFTRERRDSPTLQGSIYAPRKCGIVKGDGLFLLTGRLRLGELHMGCAPYLDEWVSISNRAQLQGRMECTLD